MADPTSRGMFEHEAVSLFDESIRLVSEKWEFNESRYPNMPPTTVAFRRMYKVNHCLLHINKSAGNIAAYLEFLDHNRGWDGKMDKPKGDVLSILQTCLRLAQILGISGKDIVDYLENKK